MLRLLNKADLPSLMAIETLTQVTPWTEDIFNQCLDAGSKGWVMEVDGIVVGFILILMQAGEAHILNLCVSPSYQGKKLGFQLLQHALSTVTQQGAGLSYLEVRRSNTKAIALYQKMGFIQIGERKDYYMLLTKREDALVFAKNLAE